MCDIIWAKETPPDPLYPFFTETQRGHKQLVRIQKKIVAYNGHKVVVFFWSKTSLLTPG